MNIWYKDEKIKVAGKDTREIELPKDQWVHISVIQEHPQSEVKVYLDGKLVD